MTGFGIFLPAELMLQPDADGVYLLREMDGGGQEAAAQVEELSADSEGRRGLFCRRCGNRITGEADRITVNGSHAHTFFNPAGILFELGCFRNAPGCTVYGEASGDFTWFAGCLWRLALCGQCTAHLGWRFENKDGIFFCLILSHLTDGL